MKTSDIRQLKLTTGCELICEVLEWPDEDESDMVIRNALEIVTSSIITSSSDGYRYYTFRPWMTMQEGNDVFMTLNINHVVGEALPTRKIMEYYVKVVTTSNKVLEDDGTAKDNLDDWIERLKASLHSIEIDTSDDSDQPKNIITFPGNKDKIH